MRALCAALALSTLLAFLAGDPAFAGVRQVSPPPQRPLLWPLEVPGTLLSSFGEYRYDHLHAGIDISTGGATGYKVLAAANGEIYRLKVEWRGYGRALYLRHPGGRFTVYGHLERFEDRSLHLERRVARRQAETGTRYPGDIYLEPPIPVRRGQVIGYSGESGVGLPHLHFELRAPEDAPLDPFASGLRPPQDRRPPVLEKLVVTAATVNTFIDGVQRERAYPLTRRAGIYTSDGPVRVGGPFLLALTAHDPAGPEGKAGVRSIHMTIDGSARYHIAFRTFRFDQYPLSGLIYDHRLSRLGPAAFTYRLVRLPGNDLAASAEPPSGPGSEQTYPGALDLPSGRHVMEVSARDAAGNESLARVCVLVAPLARPRILEAEAGAPADTVIRFELDPVPYDPGPTSAASPCPAVGRTVEAEIWSGSGDRFLPAACDAGRRTCGPPAEASGDGNGVLRLREVLGGVPGPWEITASGRVAATLPRGEEVRLDFWPGFLDVLIPAVSPGTGSLVLAAGSGSRPIASFAYRDGLMFGASADYRSLSQASPLSIVGGPRDAIETLVLDTRHLRTEESLSYHGPGFAIELPVGSRFFPGPLVVRTEQAAGESALPSLSDAVDLLPAGEALRDRGTLVFDLDPEAVDPRSVGIYRFDPNRSRWAYEGGDLDASGKSLSIRFRRYGRFAMLQDASPPAIESVHPMTGARGVGRRPRIWARVEEEGKGLDDKGVAFQLDGRPLDSEFDPDRGLSRVLTTPPLAPGPHRLQVKATDLAGNTSETVEVTFTVR
jgi:peptidase M23-like protein